MAELRKTEATAEDVLVSIRRTLVPVIVGFILAQAARYGFNIEENQLVGVLEALITGVYYSVIRVFEVRFPQLGVLLGATKQPIYIQPAVTPPAPTE